MHLSLALAAVVVVVQTGCATGVKVDPRRLRLPPPPSEESRSQLGRMRLSEGGTQAKVLFTGPAKGGGEGAARGAAIGAGSVLSIPCGGPGCILLLFAAPPAALVGAVVGAARAEPAAKVEEQEKAFKAAMEELKVSETFHRCVGDRLRELTPAPGSRVMFEEPASTILEVVVEQVRLAAGELGIKPPLSFVLTERTRLIRASDGTELYGHWLTYRGRPQPLEDWFVQNSMLLREETERACRELAERLVDEVFLLYLLGAE